MSPCQSRSLSPFDGSAGSHGRTGHFTASFHNNSYRDESIAKETHRKELKESRLERIRRRETESRRRREMKQKKQYLIMEWERILGVHLHDWEYATLGLEQVFAQMRSKAIDRKNLQAVLLIQTHWREFQCRMRVKKENEKLYCCATKIQSHWRGYTVRIIRKREREAEKQTAVLKIQRVFRGYMTRSSIRQEQTMTRIASNLEVFTGMRNKLQHECQIIIAKNWRVHLAKKRRKLEMERKRREEEEAERHAKLSKQLLSRPSGHNHQTEHSHKEEDNKKNYGFRKLLKARALQKAAQNFSKARQNNPTTPSQSDSKSTKSSTPSKAVRRLSRSNTRREEEQSPEKANVGNKEGEGILAGMLKRRSGIKPSYKVTKLKIGKGRYYGDPEEPFSAHDAMEFGKSPRSGLFAPRKGSEQVDMESDSLSSRCRSGSNYSGVTGRMDRTSSVSTDKTSELSPGSGGLSPFRKVSGGDEDMRYGLLSDQAVIAEERCPDNDHEHEHEHEHETGSGRVFNDTPTDFNSRSSSSMSKHWLGIPISHQNSGERNFIIKSLVEISDEETH